MSAPEKDAPLRSSFASFAKDDAYRVEVERSFDFLGLPHDFFVQAKGIALLDVVQRHLGNPKAFSFLDVGCGVGSMQRYVAPAARASVGIDMSKESIATARSTYPSVEFHSYDGGVLPFTDSTFDVVFAVNVMHHVPPAQWQAFSAELLRVVQPGGIVCVFEHNPYNPLTRLAVFRCEFDADAVLLSNAKLTALLLQAGGEKVESRYILFFPFATRLTRTIENTLRSFPMGAQHYTAVRKGK